MKRFTATIWEKAEHWTFETSLSATDEAAARAELRRDYPARAYTIREVRLDNTFAGNFS